MASRGVNKVILIGNLGADPDVRTSTQGKTIANVNIATAEIWKDQQGQRQERTEWHRVVFFGRTAEVARDYIRKGSRIYVEGRLRTRKWQDKQGADHYTTEILADEFQMMDRPDGGQQRSESQPQTYQRQETNTSNEADFDDDIPF